MTHAPQLQPCHDSTHHHTCMLNTRCSAPKVNVQVRGQVAEVGALESHLQGQHALFLIQRVLVQNGTAGGFAILGV